MHPADQMEGFLKLIDEGLTVAQVAGRFGVTVATVERRLKLARIAPRFLAMYRAGDIQTDQLQALSLTDDHVLQESTWDSLSNYQRSAYHLRAVLTETEVLGTSELAKFVGVEEYEAAGGKVRRDLFATNAADCFFQDSPLLNSLALAKLETAGIPVVAEGWSWVEYSLDTARLESRQYGREGRGHREATESEKVFLATLDDAQELAQKALDTHMEGDEEAKDFSEICDALETASLEADRRAAEGWAALDQWTPEQLARAGAVVKLDYNGRVDICRGLVRPSDKKAAIASMQANGEEVPREMKAGMRAEYSEKHMKDMTAHRTAAMQAALVQNPRVALVALVSRMASTAFDVFRREDGGFKFSMEVMGNDALARDASDFGESPAAIVLAEAETQWGERLPGDPTARFAWLMTQDQSVLLDLLAYCTARSFNVTTGFARVQDHSDVLAETMGVDMADWWTPTTAKFVGCVSKSKAVEVVQQATGVDVAKPVGLMKKPEAVAFCAAKLEGTRWLPTPLRTLAAKARASE
jgi:ParB family chromosome partitioning protein